MELPYGISGFYNSDEPKPPEVDVKKYKELCNELASRLDGELAEFNDALYPANFHKARFKFPHLTTCLLMNKHYPFLAFAATVETEKIEFYDFPAAAEAVSGEFTVLSSETLESKVPESLFEEASNTMSKGTTEQIKYWKPETIGQIIFNFWD